MNDDHSGPIIALDDVTALGGVQRVVTELADGFAEASRPATVLGLWDSGPTGLHRRRHATETVVVNDDRCLPLYSPLTSWQRAKLRMRGLGSQIRAFDATVARLRTFLAERDEPVIAMQLSAAEHLVAAGIEPERLIVQFHSSFAAAQAYDLDRLRRLVPHAAQVLCLTAEDARLFRAAGVAGMDHQRNPIDVQGLDTGPDDREAVVVAAGRFENVKAYDVLLDAWDRIWPHFTHWRLELYGDGPDRDALVRQAGLSRAQIEIRPTTRFLQRRMRTASVHALSSRHEGMGMVIAEAMCAHTPTVATDCSPGVRELVIPGRTGELVPVGDPAALAEALGRLMADRGARTRMGAQARALIEDCATPKVIDEWIERLGLLEPAQRLSA